MRPARLTVAHIARWRLQNQALARSRFDHAVDVVRWLGAVQAQDFAGATWAVGQRMAGGSTAAHLGRTFDEGAILRTHLLRPTWHFVLPEDIRWLLALTAPRINAVNAYGYRRFGLDAAARRRTNALIERALRGRHLTRADVVAMLRAARVASDPIAISYVLMAAELDGLICSGPREGKQHSYALLDERVPPTAPVPRDEAIARLTRRFFASHGPATARDFSWWSGLLGRDVRIGLELMKADLACDMVDGVQLWRIASDERPVSSGRGRAQLLPNYDEYLVAYADRRAAYEIDRAAGSPRATPLFANTVLIDGRVVATWQRSLNRDAVVVLVTPMRRLKAADKAALSGAAERYAAFVGKPLRLTYTA